MMEGSVAALHNSTFLPPQLRLCGLPSTALIRRPSARTLHALSPSCDLSRSYPQGSPLRQCSLLRVPHELANSRLGCSEPKRGAPLVKSVAAASDGAADPANLPQASDAVNETGKTLQLGLLFGLWYLFNIYFNIYNKQVLKVYQFPVTVTEFQFFIGSLIAAVMWTLGVHKRPQVSTTQLLAILPLACVHTMGNLFTNMSLGKVAVSFTHTIKAMEPFFSVLLSALFLGEYPSLLAVASLLPIVGGVALASLTEASFNWTGFLSAMASNVTFQSRNVLSKKLMVKKED